VGRAAARRGGHLALVALASPPSGHRPLLPLPPPRRAPTTTVVLVQRVWYFSGVSPYDFPAMSPRILPRYSERTVLVALADRDQPRCDVGVRAVVSGEAVVFRDVGFSC